MNHTSCHHPLAMHDATSSPSNARCQCGCFTCLCVHFLRHCCCIHRCNIAKFSRGCAPAPRSRWPFGRMGFKGGGRRLERVLKTRQYFKGDGAVHRKNSWGESWHCTFHLRMVRPCIVVHSPYLTPPNSLSDA